MCKHEGIVTPFQYTLCHTILYQYVYAHGLRTTAQRCKNIFLSGFIWRRA